MKLIKFTVTFLLIASMLTFAQSKDKSKKKPKRKIKSETIASIKMKRSTKTKKVFSVRTFIEVKPNGDVIGVTYVATKDKQKGFTGSSLIVFLDNKNKILHKTKNYSLSVRGKMKTGSSARTLTWKDKVPKKVLKEIKKIAILHFHNKFNTKKWLSSKKAKKLIIKIARKW